MKRHIAIIVAMHKSYWIPGDEIYVPVLVGAAGKTGDSSFPERILPDDNGENISDKNESFCELTGLYWAWKNMDAEIYGLCHYRRYLGNIRFWKPKTERILRREEIEKLLTGKDMILPRKRHYWIETRRDQYAHAHHQEDLETTEMVLAEKYPQDLAAWDRMLQKRNGHICNLFILRRELFKEYCKWLFDILFEVERRLDIGTYSEKDRRVFGYLAERLLDVWIEREKVAYTEVPTINLEKQHWFKKAVAFLKRKYRAEIRV